MREVLCNPKYTGHMVYNRRKNPRPDRGVPGRVNPPTEWVWSSKPTHEPLTTRALFDAGTPIGKANKGSRPGSGLNVHSATKRSYRMRSHVICELCGRRLSGKTRRVGDVYSYYACEPVPGHRAGRDWYPTHPKSLWIREDKLLIVVRGFFSRRIFGPDRAHLLDASPQERPTHDPTAARAATLHAKIKDLDREQANIIAELRAYQPIGDPDIHRQWRDQLRQAFAEIATRRQTIETQLAALTSQSEPAHPQDRTLLGQLPVIEGNLANLPEDVERDLWDRFHLQVRYHEPTGWVTIRATIDAQTIDHLTTARPTIMAHLAPASRTAGKRSAGLPSAADGDIFSLAGSAPGRTHKASATISDLRKHAPVEIEYRYMLPSK
jgi:hypothetical protein